ncbi:protein MPODD, putative [Plasmodium sp. DRC-Itaito]|uniref:protein MPODD, putative n=1 Tax=Plasmodium sp. gorilla clade G2 TaxID=880535 RepID=UPI000D229E6B|nr:protein MPODD, putative [Plasmodium sp. gorilla clade G2]SOV13499.1 protein MPODD, putative [Plasmodium sp. gorilla clade G2]SOV22172.1 protein MPODD, putative [Plasmodium sp. DRC-Itaito]
MIKLPFYSFNKNSLLVQCFKSACVYYIPQNLLVLSAFIFYKYKKSQFSNGKRIPITNCSEAIHNFVVEKKLKKDDIKIQKKKNVYIISLV